MKIFDENKASRKRLYIGLAIMMAVLIGFYVTFIEASKSSAQEKMEISQRAIERAVINCYAIEGFYPQSIKYIEENYGVIIDHNKYIIEYNIVGSNVLPEVRVVEKGSAIL